MTQATSERGAAVRRVLLTAELLGRYHLPVTLDFVHRMVEETTGRQWCQRTTYRDLQLLSDIGVARSVPGKSTHWQAIPRPSFSRLSLPTHWPREAS